MFGNHFRRKLHSKLCFSAIVLACFMFLLAVYASLLLGINIFNSTFFHRESHTIQMNMNNEDVQEIPEHGGDYYFLETKGEENLNLRQLCALESTARLAKGRTVCILSENLTGTDVVSRRLIETLGIVFQKTNFESLIQDTPISTWYSKRIWQSSKFRVSHLSDILRYAVIWKHGGIYMDLDFIVTKPLGSHTNTLARESRTFLASGFISLDKGHPLMLDCLKDIPGSYNPHIWVCIGPSLLTKQYIKFCGQVTQTNCSVRTLDPADLFPVHYSSYLNLVSEEIVQTTMAKLNSSLAVHFWNQLSADKAVPTSRDCALTRLARAHCPIVFQHAQTLQTI